MNIFSCFKELRRGKDLYRILMNKECKLQTIKGKTLDIGSGMKMASYHRFLKREKDVVVEFLDLGFEKSGGMKIDLEKDFLPHRDGSVDTVLLFNVLEHIYNFSFILSEVKRVLKPNGQLIGAVPFLVAYHPDPHDYWRFTRESLEKIFMTAGFSNIQIKPFGCGPVSAGFSQMEIIMPRVSKVLLLPFVLFLDKVIIKFRPKMNSERFSLGLFFSCSK